MLRADKAAQPDEIIARHINPMAAHARDVINFRYYRDTKGGNREKAEEMLRADKAAQPAKIHYFFSASKELPGKFMLSYLPRTKATHEFVTITPEGFRYRKQQFESIGMLIKWFKENFREPIPAGTPRTPGGRLTNRTPYLTGTPTGGGAGHGGITPGAMSMAAGTPYAHTPVGYGANVNTPYTPSGQTPILTPYNTPGPSMTPRPGHSGSNTPRGRHMGYGAGAGGQTPRGGFAAGQTPVLTPFNTPGPSSRAAGMNTPRGQMPSSGGRQGSYGGGGGNSRSGGSGGEDRGRDDKRYGDHHRSSSSGNGSQSRRTPRGSSYGDATPLYGE